MGLTLTEMDYVRAAIAQARAVGLNLNDVAFCAEHATDGEAFDRAIDELAQMTPNQIQVKRMMK